MLDKFLGADVIHTEMLTARVLALLILCDDVETISIEVETHVVFRFVRLLCSASKNWNTEEVGTHLMTITDEPSGF
jgi:endonuclease III